jgi:hypothetical protein
VRWESFTSAQSIENENFLEFTALLTDRGSVQLSSLIWIKNRTSGKPHVTGVGFEVSRRQQNETRGSGYAEQGHAEALGEAIRR